VAGTWRARRISKAAVWLTPASQPRRAEVLEAAAAAAAASRSTDEADAGGGDGGRVEELEATVASLRETAAAELDRAGERAAAELAEAQVGHDLTEICLYAFVNWSA
jgi:hypothetical protein